MASKKSGMDLGTLLIYGVGAYFVYSNWASISAWFGSLTSSAAAAATGATYPNSPVPLTVPTSQTYVDSSGNQWQFSTQTGQWVIAAAAVSPTPAPTAISTSLISPGQTVAPASAGTLVPLGPVASTPPVIATMPPTSSQQGPGLTVATSEPAPPPGSDFMLMRPFPWFPTPPTRGIIRPSPLPPVRIIAMPAATS